MGARQACELELAERGVAAFFLLKHQFLELELKSKLIHQVGQAAEAQAPLDTCGRQWSPELGRRRPDAHCVRDLISLLYSNERCCLLLCVRAPHCRSVASAAKLGGRTTGAPAQQALIKRLHLHCESLARAPKPFVNWTPLLAPISAVRRTQLVRRSRRKPNRLIISAGCFQLALSTPLPSKRAARTNSSWSGDKISRNSD